jgi:inosine-uridine nucleoside N-ribohydrolase
MASKPIPTILDTDIGGDIDDTWALGFLLCCPEVDLRLVVTDVGNTTYRARVAARFLELAGRSDIPVAVGLHQKDEEEGQAAWVEGYALDDYPGAVHRDGVTALVDTIMASPEPLTLLCIGPVPNIARALELEPRIAGKCHFVGMHGSVYRGYGGDAEPAAEWNVVCDAAACRAVFEAPWLSKTITPLDTCGIVQLKGERYARVRDSGALIPRLIMENYRIWAGVHGWVDPEVESSVLFDTVAAWLVFSRQYLDLEPLPIRVTDDGFTRVAEGAPVLDCAVEWNDLDAFEDVLVSRLCTMGPVAK